MKKNEFYEGVVSSLIFPNKGLVCVEGEEVPVTVKNTLPGQKVRFQLKKASKTIADRKADTTLSTFFRLWRLFIPDIGIPGSDGTEIIPGAKASD